MTFQKTRFCILKIVTVVIFALLCADVSVAGEKWLTMAWDDDADGIAKFDALCVERGMTSFDVLEANGYLGGALPSKGEELLVPESRSSLLDTWLEVRDRKGEPEPLVTVRLHGVPAELRENPPETEPPMPDMPDMPEHPAEPDAIEPHPVSPDALALENGLSVRELLTQTQETPLVTVRLHGVPSFMRDQPEETQPAIDAPAEEISSEPPEEPESKPEETASSKLGPTIVSLDIVIPPPLILKPQVIPSTARETPARMIWPLDGKVSSGFGRRGRRGFHAGIDIPMPSETPIVAATDGVVLLISTSRERRYRGYGNAVLIDHGDGIVTLYAHCSRINVEKGQEVRQGDVVAFVGRTGRATTAHLHFEIRKNGKPVDPIPYLPPH
ncbi:MAG: M23 family metallopeptidase [Synergistaceae bacterium]|nr:M23 family metallopeptidase [Synergistaceae bacterium]